MPKKTSVDVENKIISLSGKSYNKTQVAQMVGVTHKVVSRIAEEKGLIFAAPPNTRTPPEVEARALEMFNHGHNTTHISKSLSLSMLNVNRILKRNGVDRIPKNMLNLTIDDKKEICSLYEKGFSTVDIAKMFKDKVKADKTVANVLREFGVEVGTAGSNSFILNESFFENIDTEQKAYYLGFIYADGNVRVTNRGLWLFQMELEANDAYILEQLVEALQSKKKVKDFANKEVYYLPSSLNIIRREGRFDDDKYRSKVSHTRSIHIYSKKIYDDLAKWGVNERKTFSLSFPNNLPDHLTRHFIRGYFDGDGSFTDSGCPKYVFYGQPEFLEGIHQALKKSLGVNDVTVFHKSTVSMLTYGSKKDVLNIFHYLYDDTNHYLTRKKNKALPYTSTEVTCDTTSV